jgi:hypothetical protein
MFSDPLLQFAVRWFLDGWFLWVGCCRAIYMRILADEVLSKA